MLPSEACVVRFLTPYRLAGSANQHLSCVSPSPKHQSQSNGRLEHKPKMSWEAGICCNCSCTASGSSNEASLEPAAAISRPVGVSRLSLSVSPPGELRVIPRRTDLRRDRRQRSMFYSKFTQLPGCCAFDVSLLAHSSEWMPDGYKGWLVG